MIRLVNIFILLFVCHYLNAKNTTFPTLEDLDKVVANQQIYTNARLRMLDSLKSDLRKADDLHKKYAIEKELFAGYQSFVVDSALLYAQKKLSLAQRLNDAEELSYSYLDVASMLIKGGNYKEANEVLQRLNVRNASSNLRNYYYTVNQDLYTTLQTVSLTANERKLYNEKSSLYKDSILSLKLDPSVWVVTDRMMDKHRYKDALQILLKEYPTLNVDDRRMAYVAYSISDIYRLMGNREKEKQYLIVSAIADIKSAVKEYISLRRLATLLYEDGDIERSYLYMKRALEDAIYCNARLRVIEVSDIMPIINKAYEDKTQREKHVTLLALVSISVLSLMLIGLVFLLRRQMKKLSVTQHALRDKNAELYKLNDVLSKTNDALSESNDSLSEASRIKDMYIAQFMTECSTYIDKMELYRKQLRKVATTGSKTELLDLLKSPTFIEKEVDAFFATFDATFLSLFPNFVHDFNQLLLPESQVVNKKDKRLNTELRICALIRLGISDNERLAAFLRCSKATIYSYRSRTRLKSLQPDLFEEQLMNL
jgi:putative regulatory protein